MGKGEQGANERNRQERSTNDDVSDVSGGAERLAQVGNVKYPGFDAVPIPWPSGLGEETACHGQTDEVFEGAPASCG